MHGFARCASAGSAHAGDGARSRFVPAPLCVGVGVCVLCVLYCVDDYGCAAL